MNSTASSLIFHSNFFLFFLVLCCIVIGADSSVEPLIQPDSFVSSHPNYHVPNSKQKYHPQQDQQFNRIQNQPKYHENGVESYIQDQSSESTIGRFSRLPQTLLKHSVGIALHVGVGIVLFFVMTVPLMGESRNDNQIPAFLTTMVGSLDKFHKLLRLEEGKAFLGTQYHKFSVLCSKADVEMPQLLCGALGTFSLYFVREFIFRVLLQTLLHKLISFPTKHARTEPEKKVGPSFSFHMACIITGIMDAFLTKYNPLDTSNDVTKWLFMYLSIHYAHFAGTVLGPTFQKYGLVAVVCANWLWHSVYSGIINSAYGFSL
mmetsp:Transcript_18507/g.24452  ORF Transcript_18507/g.24452 Transcript_18507/m.24452 type:complete len:318 (+) Transcript_18507:69-1022(+)